MHPVLQAFLTANSNRYPDLKITQEEDHLVCKYTDVDGLTYRSEGVILNGDAYPFFYCDDDGGGVSEPSMTEPIRTPTLDRRFIAKLFSGII